MNLLTMATLLGVFSVLLLGPVSMGLSGARWVYRAPRSAVVLWQCVGVAAVGSGIAAGLGLAVAPYRAGFASGTEHLVGSIFRGHPLQHLGLYDALGLTLAADLLIVLCVTFGVMIGRTVRHRARHRRLLDLVTLQDPEFPGTEFLADQRAVAYCLPGVHPRIVLSKGTRTLLDSEELWAVIHHERGHAEAHHGLVMLPMVGLETLLGWIPYARLAPGAMSLLLEMSADDFSARRSGRQALAAALIEMAATGWTPKCSLAATGSGVGVRVTRLLCSAENSKRTAALAIGLGLGALLLPLGLIAVS